MEFRKNFFRFLNNVFPFKKPKFDLESWFVMNFKQVCFLYHDFNSFLIYKYQHMLSIAFDNTMNRCRVLKADS